MANKQIHAITGKNIAQAVGVGLVLAVAAFLVSPFSRLYYFTYGLIYLFGTIGYWVLLPFIGLIGILLSIKGTEIKHVFSWRIYVGFFVFFLGLLALMSYLEFQGEENINDASLFFNNAGVYWLDVSARPMSLLPFDMGMGGGYAGYYLSALLLLGGRALDLALSIAFIVLGVGIVFFSPLKRFILWLSHRIEASRAQKASQRKIAQEKKKRIRSLGASKRTFL